MVQRGLGRRIVGEDRHHVGVLVAEQELDLAVLRGLEARTGREERPDLGVLARRQGRQHRPLIGQGVLDVLDPGQPLRARGRVVVRSSARAERSSWIISFSHSSEVWCWMMKSSSSCCGGSLHGCWAESRSVEAQVVAVGHRSSEVLLDAFFDRALAAAVCAHGRQPTRLRRRRCVIGSGSDRGERILGVGTRSAVRGRTESSARTDAGLGDPTYRIDERGPALARHAHARGAGHLDDRAARRSSEVYAEAWGAGARVGARSVPDLLGAADDVSDVRARPPGLVAEAWRRHPDLRIGRTGLVMEALVPAIIEQKVTGQEAFAGFRSLVHRYGERAPGPGARAQALDPADRRSNWR